MLDSLIFTKTGSIRGSKDVNSLSFGSSLLPNILNLYCFDAVGVSERQWKQTTPTHLGKKTVGKKIDTVLGGEINKNNKKLDTVVWPISPPFGDLGPSRPPLRFLR